MRFNIIYIMRILAGRNAAPGGQKAALNPARESERAFKIPYKALKSIGPGLTIAPNRTINLKFAGMETDGSTSEAESGIAAEIELSRNFEAYFRFLDEYWSLFDWPEAVRRCWKPIRFHDIRL
jgi:hypothetical protein